MRKRRSLKRRSRAGIRLNRGVLEVLEPRAFPGSMLILGPDAHGEAEQIELESGSDFDRDKKAQPNDLLSSPDRRTRQRIDNLPSVPDHRRRGTISDRTNELQKLDSAHSQGSEMPDASSPRTNNRSRGAFTPGSYGAATGGLAGVSSARTNGAPSSGQSTDSAGHARNRRESNQDIADARQNDSRSNDTNESTQAHSSDAAANYQSSSNGAFTTADVDSQSDSLPPELESDATSIIETGTDSPNSGSETPPIDSEADSTTGESAFDAPKVSYATGVPIIHTAERFGGNVYTTVGVDGFFPVGAEVEVELYGVGGEIADSKRSMGTLTAVKRREGPVELSGLLPVDADVTSLVAKLTRGYEPELALSEPLIVSLSADLDGDGVGELLESLNQSDANQDGIADAEQSHVASFPAASGEFIAIDAREFPLSNVRVEASPDTMQSHPLSEVGIIRFEVTDVPVGGKASVNLYLPDRTILDRAYKQNVHTGEFYEFDFDGSTGAEFANELVTLHLVDGGRGDADGIANGVIVDPLLLDSSGNRLLEIDANGWTIGESGGTIDGKGKAAVEGSDLVFHEGDSFDVHAERSIVVPENAQYLTIDYTVAFDATDRVSINDAFEFSLLNDLNESFVPTISLDRDSFFNYTEEEFRLLGEKTTHRSLDPPSGWDYSGTVTVDVSGLPADAEARLFVRLVNNDTDQGTRLSVLTNVAPVAIDDHYTAKVGEDLVVEVADSILVNDFDADGDDLTVEQVEGTNLGPENGQLTLNDDGTFTYTPDPGSTTDDFFTYRAFDGRAYSDPVSVTIRIAPGITSLVADSTLWHPLYEFAEEGFPLEEDGRNLPWFNVNQLRATFSEPVRPISADDVSLVGSASVGIDYNDGLLISQPTPTSLELTLRDGLVFSTDKLLLGLFETITDLGGNALDGNGDGRSGDPHNARFQVVRGDIDNNNFVLSNDVDEATDNQLGIGTYDPFLDVNGSRFILSDDVNLITDNQIGLPEADQFLTSLFTPDEFEAASLSSKFFVVDSENDGAYRYTDVGEHLNPMPMPFVAESRGATMTADGERLWTVDETGRVFVYETDTAYFLGSWLIIGETESTGIATDGTNIWTLDANRNEILLFENQARRLSGQIRPNRRFELNEANTDPTGMTTDGTNLWVTDKEANRVFVYDTSGELQANWRLDELNGDATGITLNPAGGNDLWVVDGVARSVFHYSGAMDWRETSESASSTFALNPNNQNPQGIADPPPAANVTWVGGASGMWSVDSNWSTGTAPETVSDNVEIPAGSAVTLDYEVTINSVQGDGHIIVGTGDFGEAGGISVNAESEIGKLTLDAMDFGGSTGSVGGSGQFTVTELVWNSGGISGEADLIIPSGGTLTVPPDTGSQFRSITDGRSVIIESGAIANLESSVITVGDSTEFGGIGLGPGKFVNRGSVVLQGTVEFDDGDDTFNSNATDGVFENSGTVTKLNPNDSSDFIVDSLLLGDSSGVITFDHGNFVTNNDGLYAGRIDIGPDASWIVDFQDYLEDGLSLTSSSVVNSQGQVILRGTYHPLVIASGAQFNVASVDIQGGVMELNANATIPLVKLSSGAITGTGRLTTPDMHWTGGLIADSGEIHITGERADNSPARLFIEDVATNGGSVVEKYLAHGRTIRNSSQIEWQGLVGSEWRPEFGFGSGVTPLVPARWIQFFSNGFPDERDAVTIINESGAVVAVKQPTAGTATRVGLTQHGDQSSFGQFINDGTVTQSAGSTTYDFLMDLDWLNQGTAELLHGALRVGGDLSNFDGATLRPLELHIGRERNEGGGISSVIRLGTFLNESPVIVGANPMSLGNVNVVGDFTQTADAELLAKDLTVGLPPDFYTFPEGLNSIINSGLIAVSSLKAYNALDNRETGFVTSGPIEVGTNFSFDPDTGDGQTLGSFTNAGEIEILIAPPAADASANAEANTSTVVGDFTNTGTIKLHMDGLLANSRHGRFKVSAGQVDLDGTLELVDDGSFSSMVGDSMMLIEKTESGVSLGAFEGIPEGGVLNLDGEVFHSSYQAGDGQNDFMLFNTGSYITIDDPFVVEGDSAPGVDEFTDAVFIVSLDSASENDIRIDYETIDLEALAGSDYTATSGVLVIPAGETKGRITVPIKHDTDAEENERFTLRLSNPTHALLQKPGGVATILSDDNEIEPRDSRGRDFRFAFTNASDVHGIEGQNEVNVYIAGEPNTSVTVDVMWLDGSTAPQPFVALIPDDGLLEFKLADKLKERDPVTYADLKPEDMLLSNRTGIIDGPDNYSGAFGSAAGRMPSTIHVSSDAEVSVYAQTFFSCANASSDLVFPTDVIGAEYRVVTAQNSSEFVDTTPDLGGGPDEFSNPPAPGGLFAAVANFDDTVVTITPTIGVDGRAAGIPFSVTLQAGEAYQYIASNSPNRDLSGTLVTSDKPITLIAGHQEARVQPVDTHPDSIMEVLPPLNTWGREFLLADTQRIPQDGDPAIPDVYRIIASENDTIILIDGVPATLLDMGQVHEFTKDGVGTVESNKPVMLVQLTDSSPNKDPRLEIGSGKAVEYSLPAMIVIPPYEQFLADYTIAAPDPFPVAYANVVAPNIVLGALEHNGEFVSADVFEPIGSSGFSVARIPIAQPVEIPDPSNPGGTIIVNEGLGSSHHFAAPLPFGITSYGFEYHNTHGHLGGLSLAPIATATGISLVPPTATRQVTTTHTVTAKVIDDEGRGVPGVRVDFRTEGSNQAVGFGVTSLRGDVSFTYSGSEVGSDTIIASVGQLAADATVDWQVAPPTIVVTDPLDGSDFPAAETILISGQARPGQSGVAIKNVTIDGVPVYTLDAAGNFFTYATLPVGTSTYTFVATDTFDQTAVTTIDIEGTTAPHHGIDTRGLVEIGAISPVYMHTSFHEDADTLYAEMRTRNDSELTLEGPFYIGVRNISDPLVRANDPDGVTLDGTMYWEYTEQVSDGILDPQELTDPKYISFYAPDRRKFTYDLVLLANKNDPPRFTTAPDVTSVRETNSWTYSPLAIDPDGHDVSISLSAAPDGLLWNSDTMVASWNPTSDDVGLHQVEFLAEDTRGASTLQGFSVEVLEPGANRPPAFTSTPIVTGNVRRLYEYKLAARDPDGDMLSFSVTGPTGTRIVDDNRLEWMPLGSQVGPQNISVTVTDGSLSATQSFVVLVDMEPGNHEPVIVSAPIERAAEAMAYSYQVEAVDSDNDVLAYELVGQPDGMDISVTGFISWPNPDPSVGSPIPLEVIVTDDRGGVARQAFDLSIAAANASISGQILAATDSGAAPLEDWIAYADLNNSGVRDDGEPFATTNASGNFTLTNLFEDEYVVRAERQLGYVLFGPSEGFYQLIVLENEHPNVGTFTFVHETAALLNRSPNLNTIPAQTIPAGQKLSVQLTADDPDGDAVRFEIAAGPEGATLDPITGLFEWTPDRSLAGSQDLAVIRVTDPFGALDTGAVEIEVGDFNYPPIVLSSPTIPAFAGNKYRYDIVAIDPEGTELTYRLIDPQPGMSTNADGSFTWETTENQLGEFTVHVEVMDEPGQATDHIFNLPVVGANSVPIITSQPAMIVRVGEPYAYTPVAIDSDPGDSVTLDVPTLPSWLQFNGSLISGTPTIDDITPNDEVGEPIAVRATDTHGAWRDQKFNLRVVASDSTESPNQGPAFVSGPQALATAGVIYTSTLVVSDPDVGDSVAVRSLDLLPDWLTVAPVVGATNAYRLIGTPTSADVGPLTLRFQATDSRGASVSDAFPLRIVLPNRSPDVAPMIPSAVRGGDELVGRIDVQDPDGDDFMITKTGGPSTIDIDEVGVVRWETLAQDASDTPYTLTFDVEDSFGNVVSLEHNIVVTEYAPGNVPPVITSAAPMIAAVGRQYSYDPTARDADGDPIFWTMTGAPEGAALDPASGSLRWTPDETWAGRNARFTLWATDLKDASKPQIFEVEVPDANRPPVIESSAPSTGTQGNTYEYAVRATDADLDEITFTLLPANLQGDEIDPLTEEARVSADGLIRWRPRNPETLNETDSYRFLLQVDDGRGGSAQQEFVVVVANDGTSNNRSPVFTRLPVGRAIVGQPYVSTATAIDPDGDAVSFSFVPPAEFEPSELDPFVANNVLDLPDVVQFESTGVLQFTPKLAKPYRFKLEVHDVYGGSSIRDLVIQTSFEGDNSSNQSPVINSTPADSGLRDERFVYRPKATDADGDPIVFSILAPNNFLAGEIDGRTTIFDFDPVTGQLDWIPETAGTYRWNIGVDDDRGGSDEQEFAVEIFNPADAGNTPPRILSLPPRRTAAGSSYRYPVRAVDADGDPIVYSLVPANLGDGEESPNNASVSADGVISWEVPADSLDKTYRFRVTASDQVQGHAATAQEFTVKVVANPSNSAPKFDYRPIRVATVGVSYVDQAFAYDPDGDVVRYEIADGADEGISINANTGVVSWTPQALPPSTLFEDVLVGIKAVDTFGASATRRFQVRVAAQNDAPTLKPVPNFEITRGTTFGYQLVGGDPDGHDFTYQLAGWEEAVVDDIGWISFSAVGLAIGTVFNVQATTTDVLGEVSTARNFTVTIVADTLPPTISVTATPHEKIEIRKDITLQLTATDNVGITSQELQAQIVGVGQTLDEDNWTTLELDSVGRTIFSPGTPGIVHFRGTATDEAGNVGQIETTVTAFDPNIGLPSVDLETLSSNKLTEQTDIKGSVLGDVAYWELQLGVPRDSNKNPWLWSKLTSGTTTVPAGTVLSTLDPTVLANSNYQVRLVAANANDESVEERLGFSIESQLKLGNFRVSFADISISVAGIPLTVTRTYDTATANSSEDFGYGWSMETSQYGADVVDSTLGGLGSHRYRRFIDGTRILVTTPTGETEGFTFRPRPGATLFGIVLDWRPYFEPDSGNSIYLGVPQESLRKVGDEFQLLNGRTYNVEDPLVLGQYTLQDENGLRHIVDAGSGETLRIADQFGNTLTPTRTGFISSSGRSLRFARDYRGRITKITDPNGASMTYEYDAKGRLARVQDRRQAQLGLDNPDNPALNVGESYTYLDTSDAYVGLPAQYENYLHQIVDPAGNARVTADYGLQDENTGTDEFGRLTSTTSAVDGVINLKYDIEPNASTFTQKVFAPDQDPDDANAIPISASYDNDGNQLTETSRDGKLTEMQYSSNSTDLPTAVTRVVGLPDSSSGENNDLTVKTTYNFSGFATSETDELGRTIHYRYDRSGQLLSVTKPDGTTESYVYDKEAELDSLGLPVFGTLISTSSNRDGQTFYTYDENGNISKGVLDAKWSYDGGDGGQSGDDGQFSGGGGGSYKGIESTFLFDEFGDLRETMDFQDNSSLSDFDAAGNELESKIIWVNPYDSDDVRNIVTTTTVGADGQPDVVSSVVGEVRSEYDIFSRPYKTIDEFGLVSEQIYDKRGLIIETRRETRDELGDVVWLVSRSAYDESARLILKTEQFSVSDADLNNFPPVADGTLATQTVYDTETGRTLDARQVTGANIEIAGELHHRTSQVTEFGQPTAKTTGFLNDRGYVWRSENIEGVATETLFDKMGRAIEVRTQSRGFAESIPGSHSETTTWVVNRSIYDDDGNLLVSTVPFVMPRNPNAAPGAELGQGTISVAATRRVYDGLGRAIAIESRDGVTLSPVVNVGSAETASFRIDDLGSIRSVSETLYDANGRVWRRVSARIPMAPEHATYQLPASYPVHGNDASGRPVPDRYAGLGLTDGRIADAIFDDEGRVIARLTHPLPVATADVAPPSEATLVRVRSEVTYERSGAMASQASDIYHFENDLGDTIGDPNTTDKLLMVFRYDEFGNATETRSFVGTEEETYLLAKYDNQNRVIADTRPIAATVEAVWSDASQSFVDKNAPTELIATTLYGYSSIGQLASVSLPGVADPSQNDQIRRPVYEYTYDEFGALAIIHDPLSRETHFHNDRPTKTSTRTLPLGFGADGQRGTADDPVVGANQANPFTERSVLDEQHREKLHISFEGVVNENVYDQFGRISEMRLYSSEASYEDGMGQPDERWRYSYDSYGRPIEIEHLVANSNGQFESARVESMSYDDLGRIRSESTHEGLLQYEYDELDRLTTRVLFEANVDTQTSTPIQLTRFRYDTLSQLRAVEEHSDLLQAASSTETHHDFNALGQLTTTRLPNGNSTVRAYDEAGRANSITHFDGSDQAISSVDYDFRWDGLRTSATEVDWIDDDQVVGTPDVRREATTEWSYDDAGRLTDEAIQHWNASISQTQQFQYDLTGNRVAATTDQGNDGDVDHAIEYLYDANDRLQFEWVDAANDGTVDQTTEHLWNQTQQERKVDFAGHRTAGQQQTPTVTRQQSFEYNLLGRLASVVDEQFAGGVVASRQSSQFAYDASGNRVLDRLSVDSNADNSPESVESTRFTVDQNNHTGYAQTLRKVVANAADAKIAEVNFIYGIDEIAQASEDIDPQTSVSTESLRLFIHDPRGSVRSLDDESGAREQTFVFDGYGQLLAAFDDHAAEISTDADSIDTELLFNGEAYSWQTGLQYLRDRHYDPSTGRLNRMDPHPGELTSPWTLHRYGYVHGDPVNFNDPSGQFEGLTGMLASIGVGATARSKESTTVGVGTTAGTTTYRTVRAYQFAMKVLNRLEDLKEYYDTIKEIIEILDFTSTMKDKLRDELLGSGTQFTLSILGNTILDKDLTAKIPKTLMNRLGKVRAIAFKVFRDDSVIGRTVSEFMGEIATGLIVNIVGFVASG